MAILQRCVSAASELVYSTTRHKVNGTHCIHATTERGEQLVHTLQVEVWLLGSVAASGAHQPRFITTERALCQASGVQGRGQ